MEVFEDEVFLVDKEVIPVSIITSIQEGFRYVGNHFGTQDIISSSDDKWVFNKEDHDITVEVLCSELQSEQENTESIAQFYLKSQLHAVFSKSGFATRIHSIHTINTIMQVNGELKLVKFVATKESIKPVIPANPDPTILFTQKLPTLFRYMKHHSLSLGSIDINNIKITGDDIFVSEFRFARPEHDTDGDENVSRTSVSITIASLLLQLDPHWAQVLCQSLMTFGPIWPEIWFLIQIIAQHGLEFGETSHTLQLYLQQWRFKGAIACVDEALGEGWLYRLVELITSSSFTWIPRGSNFSHVNETELYFSEPFREISIESKEEALEKANAILGLNSPYPVARGSDSIIFRYQLDKAVKVEMVPVDGPGLFRVQMSPRIQQALYDRGLAPKIHWISGIPMVYKGYGHAAQVMATSMDQIDQSLAQRLNWCLENIDANIAMLHNLFAIELPHLIVRLNQLKVTHGDLQPKHIVFKGDRIMVVDLKFARAESDPGADCCRLVEQLLIQYVEEFPEREPLFVELLSLFGTAILSTLQRSWAFDIFHQIAQKILTCEEIYDAVMKRKELFLPNELDSSMLEYTQLLFAEAANGNRQPLLAEIPGDTQPASIQEWIALFVPRRYIWMLKSNQQAFGNQIAFMYRRRMDAEAQKVKKQRLAAYESSALGKFMGWLPGFAR